jgi:hypothetical protein
MVVKLKTEDFLRSLNSGDIILYQKKDGPSYASFVGFYAGYLSEASNFTLKVGHKVRKYTVENQELIDIKDIGTIEKIAILDP